MNQKLQSLQGESVENTLTVPLKNKLKLLLSSGLPLIVKILSSLRTAGL